MSEYKNRRDHLMKKLGDGVLILPGAGMKTRNSDVDYKFRQCSDFRYLTGFLEADAILVLEHFQGKTRSIAFVPPKDKVKEIWNGIRCGSLKAVKEYGFDEAYSVEEFKTRVVDFLKGKKVLYYDFYRDADMDSLILESLKIARTGKRYTPIAPQTISFFGPTLSSMRQIKTSGEIQKLEQAIRITDHALNSVMKELHPGMNESQVLARIEYEYMKNGGESGYGTIVGGGANATILHYTLNNANLKDGDLLLIDTGCELDGYTADVTRCYPVNKKFSKDQKAIYEIVLEANKKAILACVPGANLQKVHKEASRVLAQGLLNLGVFKGEVDEILEKGLLSSFYMHNTSHWLGMDVHDVGDYGDLDNPRVFEPGMVLTVEPALYFNPDFRGDTNKYDGIGVRIEDDVLITENGPVVLTRGLIKEVSEIEAMMGAHV